MSKKRGEVREKWVQSHLVPDASTQREEVTVFNTRRHLVHLIGDITSNPLDPLDPLGPLDPLETSPGDYCDSSEAIPALRLSIEVRLRESRLGV